MLHVTHFLLDYHVVSVECVGGRAKVRLDLGPPWDIESSLNPPLQLNLLVPKLLQGNQVSLRLVIVSEAASSSLTLMPIGRQSLPALDFEGSKRLATAEPYFCLPCKTRTN